MKKKLLVVAIFFASLQLNAQVSKMGQPISWKNKVGISKKTIALPLVDNTLEVSTEMARRAATTEKNFRFGKEIAVSIDFMNESDVRILPSGETLRQMTIQSKGALSINLIFNQFQLSDGSRLFLFDENQKEYIGAHTALNNNSNRVLGTELIHSDKVIIELVETQQNAGKSELQIGTVVHGFIDLEQELKALNSSGDCEYDVNCPIGAGWEEQRNSVGMMVNGGGFCTGSLINNTSGTIIPYFLSANHCGTSPGGWVFRFRWESPAGQADCATAAPSVNGPETMNVNGGVLRANFADSDFTLTELNSAPNPAWAIFYNGWNRTNIPATSAVGIHHPAGDIKKISFENQPVISTNFGGSPPNTHWGVTGWDNGVTEGGSSGSPLFDQNHRTIGQLHGGASACGGSQLSDEYGKIFRSWTGGGTNSTRLSNWLDPSNTGADFIDGVDPAGPGIPLDAGVANAQGVSGTICSGVVTPQVTITNGGTDTLTSATINYGFDGATNLSFNWTGSLVRYATEIITLPSATLTGGSHTFDATVTNPNASIDGNAMNNTVNSSFVTVINGEIATLSLTMDCYGDEISWLVRDTTNTTTFFTGGPFSQDAGGTTVTSQFCLTSGCYNFTLNDSYGDGMTAGGCPSGFYTITNGAGTVVANLDSTNANFGFTTTSTFCLSSAGIAELNNQLNSWSIFPNPANAFVKINTEQIDGEKSIIVRNTTGQIVKNIQDAAPETTIELAGFSKGVYFIQLTTLEGATTKTLIVQ